MKNFIKPTVVYVSLFILLNSCSVYYKKEVSFQEAYNSRKPARLITNEDRKVKLKKIIYKDSTYYGISYYKGNKVEFPLSNETRKSLRLKDRTTSTIINVGGTVLTLGVIVFIIAATGISGDWKEYNPNGSGLQFKN